MEPKCSLSH